MSEEETPYEHLVEEARRKYAYNFPEREEERKKEESSSDDKEDKKIEKKAAEKQYYKVEVEGWARTTFKYKVLAESPQEALDLIDQPQPLLEQPRPKPNGLRKISAKVYLLGTNMLKHMRNF